MRWRQALLNPFVICPIIAAVLGNVSLGLVTSGLTVLVWGFEPGMNFIAIVTLLLVLLTKNINLEVIFLYTITIAFIIKELNFYNKKMLYIIMAIISIACYPFWINILGSISAGILNEFNIAGQLIVLAGLLLTLQRGERLLKERADFIELLKILLILIMIIMGIKSNVLLIPFWFIGLIIIIILTKKYRFKLDFFLGKIILILSLCLTSYLLLPYSLFIFTIIMISFILIFSVPKNLALIEIVYLAVIFGLVAGKMGLLS